MTLSDSLQLSTKIQGIELPLIRLDFQKTEYVQQKKYPTVKPNKILYDCCAISNMSLP